MKLSKQRKMIIGVLALVLSALAADRVFLGAEEAGPRRAIGASVGSTPSDDGPLGDGAISAAGMSVPMGESLADRLRTLSEARGLKIDGVRDAFVVSETWAPKPEKKASQAGVLRVKFAKTHELMAVMPGKISMAIVNGKCYQVGRKVDGYTLVEVGRRLAVFERDGKRVELKLPELKLPKE